MLRIVRLFLMLWRLPYEEVVTERGECLYLFRLGTFKDGVYELVLLKRGHYAPHIHDKTNSTIHIVYGDGWAMLGERSLQLRGRSRYRRTDVIHVTSGMPHGFEVLHPTLMLTRLDRPIKDPDTGEFDFRYYV